MPFIVKLTTQIRAINAHPLSGNQPHYSLRRPARAPGVPAATAADTLVAIYNDLESIEALFKQYPEQIAAIIAVACLLGRMVAKGRSWI